MIAAQLALTSACWLAAAVALACGYAWLRAADKRRGRR